MRRALYFVMSIFVLACSLWGPGLVIVQAQIMPGSPFSGIAAPGCVVAGGGCVDQAASYTFTGTETLGGTATHAVASTAKLQIHGALLGNGSQQLHIGHGSPGNTVQYLCVGSSTGDNCQNPTGNSGSSAILLGAAGVGTNQNGGTVELKPGTATGNGTAPKTIIWRGLGSNTSGTTPSTFAHGIWLDGTVVNLTEGAASSILYLAIGTSLQAVGATVQWMVYATDGTDVSIRRGTTYVAGLNKAGAITCASGDVGTSVLASTGGATLAVTSSASVAALGCQVELNATSSLTQTVLTAYRTLYMDANYGAQAQ